MKIVMQFDWGGYEACGTTTLAFEGPDLETLYCQFEDAAKIAKEKGKGYFTLWGYEFAVADFWGGDFSDGNFIPPEFYELEEWHTKNLNNPQACHE